MSIAFGSLSGLLLIAPLVSCFAGFVRSRTRWTDLGAATLTVAGLACGAVAAIGAWFYGAPASFALPLSPLVPFRLLLSLDRLSGFFLLILCAVSLPAVFFSVPYTSRNYTRGRAAWYWALLPFFLLSMVIVVSAASVFSFFAGWELMTILSAALILLEGDSLERRKNIFLYLLTMQAGAALVISAFLLFVPAAPSLEFGAIRIAAATMAPGTKTAIFLLAFLGFATKAGIIPLHVWLPRTYPIAPTPVSALMSGVMIKTAVYAFLRVVFDFLSGGPDWGGYAVLAAGAISALLGILYAIFETDLRRLLAYSSVENLGIIFLAMGASMVGLKNGAPGVAALALLAALAHSMNHAIFKSLLFLGTGAIHCKTQTLKLSELGGLLKSAPALGVVFLAGCVSIAGLPLFNGFIGEWIAFQGLMGGAQLTGPVPQVLLPLAAGVLALTGGLAVACFANAFGTAFLGRPRCPEAAPSEKIPWSMLLPLGSLAVACLMNGVAPMVLLRALWGLVGTLIPGGNFDSVAGLGRGMQMVTAVVLAGSLMAFLVRATVRYSPTWGCGLASLTTRMQYTAASFSKPIRTVFSSVYRSDRRLDVSPEEQPYFPKAVSYQSTRTLSYERLLYRPVVNSFLAAAQQLRRLQTGNIQWYLLYIFLALLSMLLLMRFR
ncbi:MAG TPA: proton-conducting transporter membrane subunit [Candidatus Saccharimonadales bacterium]|jgi:hydrogenase-4 component B|nr:proton-conducting transporter membrane subunit [Candidatus Saccharimonadales bacterium]